MSAERLKHSTRLARAGLRRALGSIRIVVPANRAVRARVAEDYRRAMGLDLSDEDRARMLRERHAARRGQAG